MSDASPTSCNRPGSDSSTPKRRTVSPGAAPLVCRLCGQSHQPVRLSPGERARCLRCENVLARGPWLGRDTTLVAAVTGLVLAIPALFQPFIIAGKFGQERGGLLFSGVEGLRAHDMDLLAVWVLVCSAAAPIALLALLSAVFLARRLRWAKQCTSWLSRAAHAVSFWAIPEVQVLAILVALLRMGAVVDVKIGAGFWFYFGMSVALFVAWKSFVLRPPESAAPEALVNS